MTAPVTLGEALIAYRRENGLPQDESATPNWTFCLGPLTLRLPNFQWRRDALLAHDLHHVLTGYPCSLSGECQVAAWEFAAGRYPHAAATLFCGPLILLGLLWSPRAIWRAVRAGRRSRSLHRMRDLDGLLAMPADAVKLMIRRHPLNAAQV